MFFLWSLRDYKVFFYGGKRTQQFAKMGTVEGGGLGSLGPLKTSLYVSSKESGGLLCSRCEVRGDGVMAWRGVKSLCRPG